MRLHMAIKLCENCGISFDAKSTSAKYCSVECRHKKYGRDNIEKLRKRTREWKRRHKEAIKIQKREHYQTLEGRFSSYKQSAKQRNLSFNLTIEQFEKITNH